MTRIEFSEDVPSRTSLSFDGSGGVVANLLTDVKARTITFRFDVGYPEIISEFSAGITSEREVLKLDHRIKLKAERIVEYLSGRSDRCVGKLKLFFARLLFQRPSYLTSITSQNLVIQKMPEKGSIVLELVMQVNPKYDYDNVYDQILAHSRKHKSRWGKTEIFVCDPHESHRKKLDPVERRSAGENAVSAATSMLNKMRRHFRSRRRRSK